MVWHKGPARANHETLPADGTRIFHPQGRLTTLAWVTLRHPGEVLLYERYP